MTSAKVDAAVVGSGPNGLSAAIALARAGRSVLVLEAQDRLGGAVATEELTLPGFHHDVFSAVYPAAAASPVFDALPLAEHGLRWVQPEIPMAHPQDDGRAAALMRDVGRRLSGGTTAKPDGSLAARAESASRALNELGGMTVVERADGGRGYVIRGHGCPLSAASGSHEEVCLAVQTLVAELTSAEVRERCDRSGDRPCCCFEVG